MAFYNPISTIGEMFTNKESGTKKSVMQGFLSPQAQVDIPIDATINANQTTKSYMNTRNTQTTSTYAPVFSDARQVSLILESPSSNISASKKDSLTSGVESNPSMTPSTSQSVIPSQTVPMNITPQLDLSMPSGMGTILLIMGVGVGGYYLFMKKKKGGK